MAEIDYSGYWTGKIEGTNQGGLTFNLHQQGNRLTGVAKLHEPALGQYEYHIEGLVAENLSLYLTPGRQTGGIILGKVQVICSMDDAGMLKGRWKSEIGTEGIFSANRFVSDIQKPDLPKKNSVFLVHGHDDGAKHAVARYLEQLGITPVILQEQINRGMTVIEKFEDFADRAGFAVVLMTPDDVGYPVGKEEERKHRSRQNVILELGYFAAHLGRDKTFVLKSEEVEMPSDILGLVYEVMDRNEGWKVRLARELKSAGFEIDMNKAL
ncbi:MAG: hypothetical protein C4516_06930 [Oxalobacter sp.]|nr:MAG: hypothetical protein C4516_06930 [Oxalobacter sp.]